MFDDYTERLFAHFVGGHWRVPFGETNVPVRVEGGTVAGYVVPAGPKDVARAAATRCGADVPALERLQTVFSDARTDLGRALTMQAGLVQETALLADLPKSPSADASQQGTILLSTPVTPLPILLDAVRWSMRDGVIWCPPPEQAILGTFVAQLVQVADLPAGAFALLHTRVAATEVALRATGLPVTQI